MIPFTSPLPAPAASPVSSTPGPQALPNLDRRVLAMGTELRLHLEGRGDLGRASEAALAECARLEAACSTWNPASAWSRLNGAQGAPVPLSGEWLELLEAAQAWSGRTEGAFDPVLGALIRAWGTRRGGAVPGPEALAAARSASGTHLLRLDRQAGTAQLMDSAAALEEGGFLKGHALDRMKAVAGCPSGFLDFGGQLLVWGAAVDAAIADPRDRQRPRLSLALKNASLSTSGTSERGHHLLDPRSGRPCQAWGAVAVVAPTGLEADLLSTVLYVLGPEAGLAWAEREGVAAAFLLNDGGLRFTAPFRTLNPRIHPKETP